VIASAESTLIESDDRLVVPLGVDALLLSVTLIVLVEVVPVMLLLALQFSVLLDCVQVIGAGKPVPVIV
jgi:hypothetical protein